MTTAGHFVIPLPAINPSSADVKNAVDWVGGTTITIALFALMFALTEGNVVGWGKPYIGVIIAISVVLMAAFIAWQVYLEKRTTRRPLVKVSIFKNFRVSAAMVTMGLFFASFNNYLIFATYYFQDYHGLDAIQTTVRFLPTGVVGGMYPPTKLSHSVFGADQVIVMTVFVTSQILARVKVNHILMFGTLCCTIASLLFAVPIPVNEIYWAYGFPAMCLCVLVISYSSGVDQID